jgi:hypothetical protein
METFKEKGLGILFGQFLFLDYSFRWFLVGPPNHTFTHWKMHNFGQINEISMNDVKIVEILKKLDLKLQNN